MPESPRVIALCAVAAGIDVLRQVERAVGPLAAVVGLAANEQGRPDVAGWIDVAQAADLATPRHEVNTYTLSAPQDRQLLEALKPDLVLVLGWQRLVPDWLIRGAKFGAWGVHGSPEGITAGRGRSPQNWALLLGADSFELSLFRISVRVDDGPILATRHFKLLDEDDIASCYAKTMVAAAAMVSEMLAGASLDVPGVPQQGTTYYYPQRKQEDGWVDWNLPAADIARHCRALTRPYPGLRTADAANEVVLWRAQRFDDDTAEVPGTIGPVLTDGTFIVSCGDGRILVRDWSATAGWSPQPGSSLQGRDWLSTLRSIMERHRIKCPNQPLTPRLTRLLHEVRDES